MNADSRMEIDPRVCAVPDRALVDIAEFAATPVAASAAALAAAHHCLLDALADGFRALQYPRCTRLLGPLVPGATMTHGSRVPGTSYELDPAMAAFNIGAMVRWLAADAPAPGGCHPADPLGGILAVGDYLARRAHNEGRRPPVVRDLLTALIMAHEIQCVLALEGFEAAGIDPTLLVRVASTAVITAMLGGSRQQIVDALSNAWLDGGALLVYRHAPGNGSRKCWAAGDAGSRAVRLACMARAGEEGCPTALTAPHWGVYDALFNGRPFSLQRPLGCQAMETTPFDRSRSREKFAAGVSGHFETAQAELIQSRCADRPALLRTPINEFVAILVKNG